MLITICKKWASDKKFTTCGFLSVLICNNQITVAASNTNRKCLIIRKCTIYDIITAYIGCFCRTKQIGIENIRERLPPVI